MWQVREKEEGTDSDLIFQTLDWYNTDITNEETDLLEYKIYTFGINIDNKPVSLQINGYYPFFFIEIPGSWDSTCIFTMREIFKGLQDMVYLERKRYYGFENNKLRKFLKLSFYNLKSMRNTRYKIDKGIQIPGRQQPTFFPLYESNIDPILRFMHLRDILSAGWIKIAQGKYSFGEMYECNWKEIYNCSDYSVRLSNVRVLYFDIEACSEDGSFPNALKKNDRVTQICCITKDTVTNDTKKYLFNLGTIDAIEDTVVLQFPSEKKLLLSYAKFINETDPDIIVGYNIFGFDNGYLFERAKVLGIEEIFNYQSKINYFTEIEKKILNNQQSGFNDWKMTHLIGRTHIDLLQVIKKDFKLESYKLNNVGEHFLKQGKDDVSPKEIFEAWSSSGDREKRTRVGKYCVQDTNLCLLLFEKFAVLPNHIEMAKVTRVPLEYLVTRGQSIKVFSQIAYETRKMGYLIPVLQKENKESKFQGATVLEAKTGYYTRPVAGLDFASLYPSIMIAHNMCYSTVILDQKYNNIENITYSTIDCNDSLSVSFVQSQPGVLSGILQALWKNRKVTKKEMNAATDPFVKTVLNAKQLAIKVSMNSIYGFTGAVVGALPCLEISQSVTGCGRQMIEQTQNYAKNHFQCEIVYGDSVSADTPVLIKKDGTMNTLTIEELFNKYPKTSYPQFKSDQSDLTEKETTVFYDTDEELMSWTATGWNPIRRIIRHRCNKTMYRVITPTGIVDVTEDHSLLNENLEEIKPKDIKIDENLFHSYPDNIIYSFSQKEMHLIRYLNQTNKNSMKLAVDNKLEANKLYIIGRYLGFGVGISYHKSFYYLSYYKYKDNSAQKINSFKNVVDIINLGPNPEGSYVYDIETEDGTFQAGIGQMIVKNTDSCYVIFPEPVDPDGTLTTLFKKAEFAAAEISKTFRKPIELEFEKFMYPLILVAKKRYMYVEWTDSKKHNGEIEAKGVELVRRDNCPYVKETLDNLLSPIMFENNLEKGRLEAERHIDMLLNGEVPIKKLILSKNLRNDYARPETIAHYQLVQKMKLRDINSAPKPGDRVPFVYVDIGDPKALSWKKVEDPEYVVENNIPIDKLYYLEHQLKNPLKTIFDILLGELKCKEMFNRPSLINAKK